MLALVAYIHRGGSSHCTISILSASTVYASAISNTLLDASTISVSMRSNLYSPHSDGYIVLSGDWTQMEDASESIAIGGILPANVETLRSSLLSSSSPG